MKQSYRSNAAFPSTLWHQIVDAQQLPDQERKTLVGEIMQRYRDPIYAFYRSKGVHAHDADDLVQSFVVDFLSKDKILRIEKRSGVKFRAWLMTCLRNHLASVARKHKDVQMISMDDPGADSIDLKGEASPDTEFLDAWRRNLLRHAFAVIQEQCVDEELSLCFDVFLAYYCHERTEQPTWQEIAEQFQLESWKIPNRMAIRIKKRLRTAIRNEVSTYAESDEEIDEELRDLLSFQNKGSSR